MIAIRVRACCRYGAMVVCVVLLAGAWGGREARAALNDIYWIQAGAGGAGNWTDTGFWSIDQVSPAGIFPNNSVMDQWNVFIDNGLANASPVTLDTFPSISGLNISAGDSIDIPTGGSLTLNGAAISGTAMVTNDGMILLNDTAPGFAVVTVTGLVSFGGSGSVVFSGNDDNLINGVGALTNEAGHTITTSGVSTFDSKLQATTTNKGVVQADAGMLELSLSSKINQATLRAINGGTLKLATTINNGSGTIVADAGSTVEYNNTTINQGILDGDGVHQVRGFGATFVGGGGTGFTIDNTVVDMESGAVLTLKSTITNNGTLRIDDDGFSTAHLRIDGDVTLNGSGQVLFSGNDDNNLDALTATDVITIGASMTVTTTNETTFESRFRAAFDNLGLVEADQGVLTLSDNDKVNQNTVRATNGGTLIINGVSVDNSAGTVTADANSVVELVGGTIAGGTLNGAGTFDAISGTSVLDGVGLNIASGATVRANTNSRLHMKGTITNNGDLLLNDEGAGTAFLGIDGDVTLNGAGRVVFNAGVDSDNVFEAVTPTDVLTIGASQTVTTTASSTLTSQFQAAFDNLGVVEADGGQVDLNVNNKVNKNVVTARNGGRLRITGITLDNTAGKLAPAAGSAIELNAATVLGGTVEGAGSVDAVGGTSTLDGLGAEIKSGGRLRVNTGASLRIKGNITVTGQLQMNDTGAGSAFLLIDGGGAPYTLGGTGELVFNVTGDNDMFIQANAAGDELVLGTDLTLRADSGAAGFIDLNTTVQEAFVLDGLVTMRNGATMTVANGAAMQGGGTLDAFNGSLDASGTIKPGNSTGTLTVHGGVTMNAGNAVEIELDGTASGEFDVLNMTGAVALGGALNIEQLTEPALGDEFLVTPNAVTFNGTTYDQTQITGTGLTDPQTAIAVLYEDGPGGGTTVDSVRLMATYRGDADGSGSVSLTDLDALGVGFGKPGTWQNGDFNYDGQVGLVDLDFLGVNFGQTVSAPSAPGTPTAPAVPEPAGVALLALGGLALLRRRGA